ncbi:hypothetical protein B4U79_07114, partial [Dinothrombium tinctorium]
MSVESKINKEANSIFAAIRNGTGCVEQELSSRKYDLNAVDIRGYSPILLAANEGNLLLIELLIKHGAAFNDKTRPENVHCDPLHIAAKKGYLDVIKLLVKNEANVNAFDSIGRTPLWYALLGGHSEVCKILLRKGARSRINCFEKSSTIAVESISVRLSSACLDSEELTFEIGRG